MDMNMSKLWETAEDRGAWRAVVHRVAKSRNDLATEQWQQIVCGCLSASMTRWYGCDRDPREGKDSDIYSPAFHRKWLTITGQKVYHRSSQNLLPVRIAWGALKNALSMSHPGMIKWEPLGVGSKHKIFFFNFPGNSNMQADLRSSGLMCYVRYINVTHHKTLIIVSWTDMKNPLF